ncbi:hypothetical protein OIU78_004323 [Salix suchowensis]|nr:hypothetical protein OIU78_004323 [Salix suchowensis]
MKSLPLHACTPSISSAIINRSYSLLHFTALSLPLRCCSLSYGFLTKLYTWRPVSRTTFSERLPEDEELPGIDVFICTADHKKEPPLEVMNTVLSAMALDYPSDKLSVYLSDDGGSSLTLLVWKIIHAGPLHSLEYEEEKEKIKGKYELFKERVNKAVENIGSEEATSSKDHSPVIEVMDDEPKDDAVIKQVKMPLLVYVSREKRPSHSHHFKAGALNVLLRVSGIMTNSPYILVLDCDMYCNDPTSARQAMCFHLDPKISPSLAFIQFPQKFRNINKNDIYDGQLRKVFMIRWQGMDGIQGPMLSGTGFYMKREALYGNLSQKDVLHLKQSFGHSNEFIMSVHKIYQYGAIKNTESSGKLQQEAQFLASCTYEKNTLWGEQERDGTLGCLKLLSQSSALSFMAYQECHYFKPCAMATLHFNLSISCPCGALATLPQLCLLNGIPIYPQVSSSWFMVFSFIFLASLLKHLEEVLSTGASIQTLLNEQRIWMMKSVTAYTYGSLDAILKCFGMREASFLPTNKVADDEQVALYQMGKLNFQSSTMILMPIITLIILNMVSFIGGVARMFIAGSWDDTFGQVFLSLYILMVNYPVIEGMLLRKDKGRVPTPVTLLSLINHHFLVELGTYDSELVLSNAQSTFLSPVVYQSHALISICSSQGNPGRIGLYLHNPGHRRHATDGEERMVQMIENPKEELDLEKLKSEIFKIRIQSRRFIF